MLLIEALYMVEKYMVFRFKLVGRYIVKKDPICVISYNICVSRDDPVLELYEQLAQGILQAIFRTNKLGLSCAKLWWLG